MDYSDCYRLRGHCSILIGSCHFDRNLCVLDFLFSPKQPLVLKDNRKQFGLKAKTAQNIFIDKEKM